MYKTKIINNKRVKYFVKNNNAKWTVIFIHGFNSSSNFASQLFDIENNYNIIAVDMVDANDVDEVKFENMIEITNKIIQKTRTRNVVLLGHSLAGGVVSKVGLNKKVKKIVYLSTITPDIQSTSAYKLLKKHHETKNKVSLMFTNKLISLTKNKSVWAHAFLDRNSKWSNVLKNTVLDEFFMNSLGTKYKLTKDKSYFVVSKDDNIINTKAFVNYVNSLGKEVTFIGKKHNPIKTAPKEFNAYLNNLTASRKRIFKKGVIW